MLEGGREGAASLYLILIAATTQLSHLIGLKPQLGLQIPTFPWALS